MANPHVTTSPIDRFFGYYPGTIAVITTAHAGARNVMSAGWHTALSAEPPLYGVAIGRERATYPLVRAAGAFAVHFLPFERADAIAGVGSVSAHAGVDKFAAFGLSTRVGVLGMPILDDAYVAFECRLQTLQPVGDHDLAVGEVIAVHRRPEAFDERFVLDPQQVRATVFYGRSIFEALGAGERAEHRPPEQRRRR
jgi:flavin reductase (DIM6/NTAB) family NADH-FMN oxidoreductase RutF